MDKKFELNLQLGECVKSQVAIKPGDNPILEKFPVIITPEEVRNGKVKRVKIIDEKDPRRQYILPAMNVRKGRVNLMVFPHHPDFDEKRSK